MSARVGSAPPKYRYRGWCEDFDTAILQGMYHVNGATHGPTGWSSSPSTEMVILEVIEGYQEVHQRLTSGYVTGNEKREGHVWVRGGTTAFGGLQWSDWRLIGEGQDHNTLWSTASYTAGFQNCTVFAGGTYYRKVGARIDVMVAAETTGVPAFTNIFNLPSGYRPSRTITVPAGIADLATYADDTTYGGFLTVAYNGPVALSSVPATGKMIHATFSFYLNT